MQQLQCRLTLMTRCAAQTCTCHPCPLECHGPLACRLRLSLQRLNIAAVCNDDGAHPCTHGSLSVGHVKLGTWVLRQQTTYLL